MLGLRKVRDVLPSITKILSPLSSRPKAVLIFLNLYSALRETLNTLMVKLLEHKVSLSFSRSLTMYFTAKMLRLRKVRDVLLSITKILSPPSSRPLAVLVFLNLYSALWETLNTLMVKPLEHKVSLSFSRSLTMYFTAKAQRLRKVRDVLPSITKILSPTISRPKAVFVFLNLYSALRETLNTLMVKLLEHKVSLSFSRSFTMFCKQLA